VQREKSLLSSSQFGSSSIGNAANLPELLPARRRTKKKKKMFEIIQQLLPNFHVRMSTSSSIPKHRFIRL